VATDNNTTAFAVNLWIDSDGDGIPDSWMRQYFGHPTGQAGDLSRSQDSAAGDGISNLQKYLSGKNPLIWDNLHFTGCQRLPDRRIKLSLFGKVGQNYTLQASTNLFSWVPLFTFVCTNSTLDVFDTNASNFRSRFYRLAAPAAKPAFTLGLTSGHPFTAAGLDLFLFSPSALNCRIEASTNLLDWVVVTNLTTTNPTTYFRDAGATNSSRRFYRGVAN
jgi:hypothetical protein